MALSARLLEPNIAKEEGPLTCRPRNVAKSVCPSSRDGDDVYSRCKGSHLNAVLVRGSLCSQPDTATQKQHPDPTPFGKSPMRPCPMGSS